MDCSECTVSKQVVSPECMYVPVPVTLRVFVQWGEHNGQDDFDVVANKVAEVLVVPEVQCSLGDLEVRTGDRFG